MAKKKDVFSEDTFISYPNDEVVVRKTATIYCGYDPRLEAHGKSKQLARKVFGIGRDRQNAVIIADGRVSKFHAVVTIRKGVAFIKDTGSTNGTLVNGKKLTPNRESELKAGDILQLGETQIRIRY